MGYWWLGFWGFGDRVLCPEISIATFSGIPALIIFLTAVLLKSWGIFSSSPAFLQAAF